MFHMIYYLNIYSPVIGSGHGGVYQGPNSYQTSSGGGYQY